MGGRHAARGRLCFANVVFHEEHIAVGRQVDARESAVQPILRCVVRLVCAKRGDDEIKVEDTARGRDRAADVDEAQHGGHAHIGALPAEVAVGHDCACVVFSVGVSAARSG